MVASPSTVSINHSGRYVHVQLQTTDHLLLAEVQVLSPQASRTPIPSVPTPTDTPTPTSTGTVVPAEPTPEPLQHAWYLYDGDGILIKGVVNSTTTYYPGRSRSTPERSDKGHYNLEVTAAGEKAQKFYFAGWATIAVRTVVGEEDALQWILFPLHPFVRSAYSGRSAALPPLCFSRLRSPEQRFGYRQRGRDVELKRRNQHVGLDLRV